MIAPEVLQQEFGGSKCRDSVVRDRATPKAPQRGFLFVMPFLPEEQHRRHMFFFRRPFDPTINVKGKTVCMSASAL